MLTYVEDECPECSCTMRMAIVDVTFASDCDCPDFCYRMGLCDRYRYGLTNATWFEILL